MIRFLVDECVSPTLISAAHARGYEATHVNFLNLSGYRDRALMPLIFDGDWTFVTNNRRDFLRLYRHVEIHAGLLIILPSSEASDQMRLFNFAIDAIEAAGSDMVNQLIEVAEDGSVRLSVWPFRDNNLTELP